MDGPSTDIPTTHVLGPSPPTSMKAGDSPSELSPLLSPEVQNLGRLNTRLPLMSPFESPKSANLCGSTGLKVPLTPPSTPQNGLSTINNAYTPDINSPVAGPSRAPSRSPGPEGESWKRQANEMLPKLNLRLENSGSVARDHLASERTFLAYVRTSLVIASTGVGLVQLFTISATSNSNLRFSGHIQMFARPLGATTVVFSLIVLLIGASRYFIIQTALTKGKFPVATISVAFLSVALSTLVVTVFGILVGVRR